MRYSWGRLPIPGPARTLEGDWRFDPLPQKPQNGSLLAFGQGRSYGDSCINSLASHISTRELNRFMSFDTQAGILDCEAGLTLDEVLNLIVPRGWFLPVVPGTRYITLGGAVANDVHGKNHHWAGSFGCHVRSLALLRSNGDRPSCSPTENSDLFEATIGGMGLTGLITRVSIELIPIASDQLTVEDLPFASLGQFLELSKASSDWAYTVAWIDTMATGSTSARGIFSRAKHSTVNPPAPGEAPKLRPSVPFAPPFSLVGKTSVRLFNSIYFRSKSRNTGAQNTAYEPFFFPLDSISDWNKIYGTAGFYQYQCVVPHNSGLDAIQQLLAEIQSSGEGSFLAVLKEFGKRASPGLMSFPRPGLTLALDFPNRGDKTKQLMNKLDQIVTTAGGALYPAKDARMSPETFRCSFPELEKFSTHIDPQFSSSFWRRVTA